MYCQTKEKELSYIYPTPRYLFRNTIFFPFFGHHLQKFTIGLDQRRLDPGKETLEGFFQVGNQKEYQNVVIISFVHLEKINIFCFMH